jgi:hypothetical protein
LEIECSALRFLHSNPALRGLCFLGYCEVEMANKRKNDDDKLEKKIVVRCTDFEYQRWKKMADSNGVTMSKMMRASLDGNKVQSKSDALAIAELRRQGGLLKKILVENPDMDSLLKSDLRETLRTMVVTMNAVMGV